MQLNNRLVALFSYNRNLHANFREKLSMLHTSSLFVSLGLITLLMMINCSIQSGMVTPVHNQHQW